MSYIHWCHIMLSLRFTKKGLPTAQEWTIVKTSPFLNGKSSGELPGNLYIATTSVPVGQGTWRAVNGT